MAHSSRRRAPNRDQQPIHQAHLFAPGPTQRTTNVTDPSRRRLERDLAASEFESGVSAGLWRVVALDWPALTIAITAGDGGELGMRLLVDGYPAVAPGGQPWDLEAGGPLPTTRWPIGGCAAQVFRPDWSPQNANAPYMACDRTGLSTHPEWATAHPHRAWTSSRTIVFYVREVHQELRAATLPPVKATA